ncbi:MAG: CCA tRNA nucleotidyltransferase [Solirubrobacterales bacterium]|nr:CCA tRNA nucleotidyltransferase [Solirubrobacterales bacterium]HMT05969.1 hypothetical protein [Solirubrobacterales bacterium]
MAPGIDPDFNRLASLIWTHPVLALARDSAISDVYLVGGAIRDCLADFRVDDIDLVVEGDPMPLARSLDPEARLNERFGTVDLKVEGSLVDIATARTETYSRPGALPDVNPGRLDEDLRRRDFTINAMAISLEPDSALVDPCGGLADLESGVLRVLHDDSFVDDPTRALRAAKYAARFGFDLEPKTAELLLRTDLGTVSRDRVEHEVRLLALEDNALDALRLARIWGLIEFDGARLDLAEVAIELLELDPWEGIVPREEAVLAAVFSETDSFEDLVESPPTPWAGYCRARGRDLLSVLLARAAGGAWLDEWLRNWRRVGLEITGADLIAAGLPEGPLVGEAIDAALEAKLNRGTSGAEEELRVALAAVGGGTV